MKIINILGGLGNQLFQYAFALAIQQAFPDELVKLNISCFKGYPLHNGFELDKILKIPFRFATTWDLCKYSYPWIHYRLWQVGRRLLPQRKGMASDKDYNADFSFELIKEKNYFDGYWQSPKFLEKYKQTIINAFSFPPLIDSRNKEVLCYIKSHKTAFIHVRRGDYINHPIFGGICTIDYYIKAIKYLKETFNYNNFIVFSNDIFWSENNLREILSDSKTIYIGWNKGADSYKDIVLMTKCNAAIVANSSFSWWGAWLGNMEVVIAPQKWTNITNHHDDIIPENWIKI